DRAPLPRPPAGPRAALPAREEVRFQERGEVLVLDPQHQVVPAEVVVAEVDSAEVGDAPVERDELLVVARAGKRRKQKPAGLWKRPRAPSRSSPAIIRRVADHSRQSEVETTLRG